MQKNILACIFTLSCFFKISAQDLIQKYVTQHAVSISSIQPDSVNFSDLKIIGDAIGDSKIVMLGEQDHGDAPTFLAKTRLIKYLHEEKGFNVLAFESDFFGLNEGWDNLPKQKEITDSFLRRNISSIWTECNTCQYLFYNYIPNSYSKGNPLIISGFDSQIFFSYSSKYVYNKLDSVLRTVKAPITALQNYSSEILPLIKEWYKYSYSSDTVKYKSLISYLSVIKEQLNVSLGNTNFWVILSENLLQNAIKYRYALTDKLKATQVRDSQMANNLRWLEDVKFKNEKIIVWAANSHIHKFSGHFPREALNEVNSMGSILSNDSSFNSKTYVIGFTSFQGSAGRLGLEQYKLVKPKKNSFENWINPSFNYAFIDFKNYHRMSAGNDEVFYMSGFGHNNYEGIWTKVFDGVFFIRDMYSCTEVK